MKGICFVEPLFNKVIREEKTQTRRIIINSNVDFYLAEIEKLLSKARYRVGEVIYLKEPYCDDLVIDEIFYKYDNLQDKMNLGISIWKNKLFMPESAARYFIKITKVSIERLQEISHEDCFKEGIIKTNNLEEIKYTYKFFSKKLNRIIESMDFITPQEAYSDLIDSINGIGTWDNNPYVYVYDFELIKD